MKFMKTLPDNSIDLICTDIPYNAVNRENNGLRNLDKSSADVKTFSLSEFLPEIYRITKGNIVIFCGKEQFSEIFSYFADKQNEKKGTVRQLIWEKSNPSPMNGKYIYLSGVENAVWFKKKGGCFNAYCKNTVFKFPLGSSKYHPTEKNHKLLRELLIDNSNNEQIVFDPCMGSGSTGIVALALNRKFIGCEIDKHYFEIAKRRIEDINEKMACNNSAG